MCEWQEISQALLEKRHELVLSGPLTSSRIANSGLDEALFKITTLNFLSISDTCLDVLPDSVSELQNLSTLVLHSNQLKKLTPSVGKLSKLKNLDVSRNLLDEFPEEVSAISMLYSLNASFNSLTTFPNLISNTWLTVLDLSNNSLTTFPSICSDKLSHLSEVKLASNNITEIPHSISLLPSLKLLDVSENKIKEVPGELSDISKLKEISLKGNPLADRRLGKLVVQCRSKQILDYIKQHAKRCTAADSENGQQKSGVNGASATTCDAIDQLCDTIEVMHITDSTPVVMVNKEVQTVRPYIVCCIVRGLEFTDDTFKKFIKMQNNIHDDVCNKRQTATLATHDLSAVAPGNLKYVARAPNEVKLQPLGSTKETTASVVFSQLKKHAQSVMLDKKRSKYSGIHKFLYLLEGKPLFPFLIDGADQVISFPPLTNSNRTKMTVNSKEMLVEVTSSTSRAFCKNVLDIFLRECVRLGIGQPPSNGDNVPSHHQLIVGQMKVADAVGTMQFLYPTRSDLVFEDAESIKIKMSN